MNKNYRSGIASLKTAGWTILEAGQQWRLPDRILSRYEWVPASVWEFVRSMDLVTSSHEKTWFLTGRDFCGESESAFTWDEWERQSLEAADTDNDWRDQILGFWDSHLPLAISVGNEYRYLALHRGDLSVVAGEEPEFEETSRISNSFNDLFRMITSRHTDLASWI